MRRRVLALIDITIIFWQHIDVMEYYTVESVLERVWRPVGLKKIHFRRFFETSSDDYSRTTDSIF